MEASLQRLRHKPQEMLRIYFVVDIRAVRELSVLVQRLQFYALIKTAVNFTILRDYSLRFAPQNGWF
jgi:hypothetical protein